MKLFALTVAAGLLGGASVVFGQSVPITNSDFETLYKPNTNQSVTGQFLTGWTSGFGNAAISCCGNQAVQWSDGTFGASGDPITVPGWANVSGGGGVQFGLGVNGSQGVWINGSGFGGSGGLVQSTTTFMPIANQTYILSIGVSDNNGNNAALPITLTLLDQNGQPITPDSQSFPTPITPAYQTYSVSYSPATLAAYQNQNLTIEFGAGSNGNQTNFDNVSLTYAPEPAAASILGLGALATLRRKRA